MVRGAISDLSVKTANVKIAQERMIADTIKLRDELSTEISNAKKLVAGTIWYQIGAQIGVAVLVGVVMVAAARWAGFGGMSDEQFSQVRADVMKASSVPHYK